MFDPTAFENMKVVLEGALYDLDLSGEIVITDRNDLMDIAKLARRYELSFALPNKAENPVIAKLLLESPLKNLAAELLGGQLQESLAGSFIHLEFILPHQHKMKDYRAIEEILIGIWGTSRKITITAVMDPIEEKFIKSIASIDFERLIREEQMDDLVEMIEFMTVTLNRLQSFQG